MTLSDLIRAHLRRWPIVLIGMIAALAMAFLATRADPVYHARTEMVFLAPTSLKHPNELVTGSESIIITAGIVAKRLNGADAGPQFNSQIVIPVGAPDLGQDTWIRLLDNGNQWVSNFDDQILLIDAIGATPEEAELRVVDAATRVSTELRALQEAQKVDPVNYISTRMSPAEPRVAEITPSRVRAAGMALLLTALATVALVLALEVRARRNGTASTPRRHRKPTKTAAPPPVPPAEAERYWSDDPVGFDQFEGSRSTPA